MKKVLLILFMFLVSYNSCAEPTDTELKLFLIGGAITLPFAVAGGTIYGAAVMPKAFYEIKNEDIKVKPNYNYNKIKKYSVCNSLRKLYINADKENVFTGEEAKGQSNIQTADNTSSVISNDELYLCINPEETKVYKNGCLDTLQKNSVQKVSGKWYLDKAFAYHNIEYVQLRNETGETAFTDVVSTIKNVYYNGEKVDLSKANVNINNFNLKEAVRVNCIR